MNKVVLMGRLTKNPEIKYAGKDNDMAVARYILAVNRRYKRDGEQEADFISCVTFGKSAEFAQKYLCLLYTSPSPRDGLLSRMPSSA